MVETTNAAEYEKNVRAKRKLVPQDFEITDWETLRPFYERLFAQKPQTVAELEQWLHDASELEAVVQEEEGWRYIRRSCNVQTPALTEAYNYFVLNVSPKVARSHNVLNNQYYASPARKALDAQKYGIFNRQVEKEVELFREENVDLTAEIEVKAQEYDGVVGAMSIEIDGQTLTLQQAGAELEKNDRARRELVWRKVANRRLLDRETLDALLDELLRLRRKVANNAGYDNFADYKHKELGRFDYTREDCSAFHDAIEKVVKPIYIQILKARASKMKMDKLRPWDLSVDSEGKPPLRPFKDGDELLTKTVSLFRRMSPELGEMIGQMRDLGRFDVASRVGKAPGGYNYPLYESGVPFIFMNAAGVQSDLTTMVHECGHAIHAFVTRDLELNAFKDTPSEIAELASMSMELMTMDYWDEFYTEADDLARARRRQISRSITGLPWIATVDSFQYWLYDRPNHTPSERRLAWRDCYERFHGTGDVDWSGLEDAYYSMWQRQLHIYHVPFYYIEYGFAQLGAFQVWRNFMSDPKAGLDAYLAGLRLGYTRSIPETYRTAGATFDFSTQFIADLFRFIETKVGDFSE